MIGEVCSGASVAAAGVANSRKVPIISPSSTSPTLSQTDFFFRTVPSGAAGWRSTPNRLVSLLRQRPTLLPPPAAARAADRYQGVAAANLVWANGGRNAALIYEDSSYGYGLAFNFIAGFTKRARHCVQQQH